jgi:hypothetical protein
VRHCAARDVLHWRQKTAVAPSRLEGISQGAMKLTYRIENARDARSQEVLRRLCRKLQRQSPDCIGDRVRLIVGRLNMRQRNGGRDYTAASMLPIWSWPLIRKDRLQFLVAARVRTASAAFSLMNSLPVFEHRGPSNDYSYYNILECAERLPAYPTCAGCGMRDRSMQCGSKFIPGRLRRLDGGIPSTAWTVKRKSQSMHFHDHPFGGLRWPLSGASELHCGYWPSDVVGVIQKFRYQERRVELENYLRSPLDKLEDNFCSPFCLIRTIREFAHTRNLLTMALSRQVAIETRLAKFK